MNWHDTLRIHSRARGVSLADNTNMTELPLECVHGLPHGALGVSFSDSADPMWIYDLKTLAFLKVNESAVRAYGFTEKEFLDMTVLDIRPSRDVERFLRSWNHPHETAGETWYHVGKDGGAFPVVITSWKLMFEGREAELVVAQRMPHLA